jgi:putative FmdB family regulatory protein
MPTYEYRCRTCGHTFDVVQAMRDDSLTACPVCGGELRKVFAAPAISFKGSGFYATDHGKKSKTGSEKSGEKSGETSGEKPAASSESSESKGDKKDKKESSKPAETTTASSSAGSGSGSGGSGSSGSTADAKESS